MFTRSFNAFLGAGLILAAGSIVSGTVAAEETVYVITIKAHRFSPIPLMIPAGKKVKITVDNQDPTPEEFESVELGREKVITGNNKGIIFLGPLKPGEYKYFGDFHSDTAQGVIVVK